MRRAQEKLEIHVGDRLEETGHRFIEAWHALEKGKRVRERHLSFEKRPGMKEGSMKKRVSKRLSSAQRLQIEALAALPEDEIDTGDIPEVRNWSGAQRGLFFRPVKKQLTLRLTLTSLRGSGAACARAKDIRP